MMAYNREVYEAATAELSRRRIDARTRAAALRDRMIARYPRVAAIEQEMASTSMQVARAVLEGGDVSGTIAKIRERNLALQDELAALLKKENAGAVNFEPQYACPACDDTGYADGHICDCLSSLMKEEACRRLSDMAHMRLTSLDEIRLEYYPDTPDAQSAMTVRQRMQGILTFCRQYADDFSTDSKSLLLRGPTGTGKTHVSLAIARTAAEKGYSVVYGPVQMLLHQLEREHFGKTEGDSERTVLECDLLVLDDLGCEFGSSFTVAALYNIINTRILCGLPTVISTNLDQEQLRERYGDQIASRIIGEYIPLTFAGRDVRQMLAAERMGR